MSETPDRPLRTCYAGHDGSYRRKRADGQAGWDPADVIAENHAWLERAFAAPGFPRQGELLELGCGAGDLSLWAAARGYAVTGIDIAPSAIAWAQEKASERGLAPRFLVGEVTALPFEPDRFDVVLDGHCMHCIVGDDRAQVLGEALRVLRPGGVFHMNTMVGDPAPGPLLDSFDPASRCLVHGDIATRYLGLPQDVVAEVEAAGFRLLRSEVVPRRSDEELDTLLLDATC